MFPNRVGIESVVISKEKCQLKLKFYFSSKVQEIHEVLAKTYPNLSKIQNETENDN